MNKTVWYNPPDAQERDRFHAGYSERAYEYLGAHPVWQDEKLHWHFAVWAPNAIKVCLTGEFSGWEAERYPMEKQYDGIWELRLPDSLFSPERDPEKYNYPDADEKLKSYKYAILGADNVWHYRGDPYGFATECRPNTANRLWNMSTYQWQDTAWMEKRKGWNAYRSPVNIYEMHLGTWRQPAPKVFYTYPEIADRLVPYVKKMGYTHVEFLPVMEHP
ncbi:MAG: 1,4-alpha-glucan branching enzyme, partial [Clostridia bacterium]|nr:1,4-alpha-glucan branching enzyme [Clostridia bacterium]